MLAVSLPVRDGLVSRPIIIIINDRSETEEAVEGQTQSVR